MLKAYLNLVKQHGSLNDFLWSKINYEPINNHQQDLNSVPSSTPLSDQISQELKAMGFKFVGSTIVYAYMQAIGMVNDHVVTCDFHQPSAVGEPFAKAKLK